MQDMIVNMNLISDKRHMIESGHLIVHTSKYPKKRKKRVVRWISTEFLPTHSVAIPAILSLDAVEMIREKAHMPLDTAILSNGVAEEKFVDVAL
jgi:hypothetical protein